jgi:hypothetical protein
LVAHHRDAGLLLSTGRGAGIAGWLSLLAAIPSLHSTTAAVFTILAPFAPFTAAVASVPAAIASVPAAVASVPAAITSVTTTIASVTATIASLPTFSSEVSFARLNVIFPVPTHSVQVS